MGASGVGSLSFLVALTLDKRIENAQFAHGLVSQTDAAFSKMVSAYGELDPAKIGSRVEGAAKVKNEVDQFLDRLSSLTEEQAKQELIRRGIKIPPKRGVFYRRSPQ